MNILMISDVYFPRINGVSTSIQTFRTEFIKKGHQVTLITPDYQQPQEENESVYRIPAKRVICDPEDRMMRYSDILKLTETLRKNSFDLVHIQTPFIAHYAGIELAKRLNLPVITTYHTFFEEYLYHYIPFLPKAALRWAAKYFTRSQCKQVKTVIVPSSAMRDTLKNYDVNSPITIIPTGIQLDIFNGGDGARFRTQHCIPPDRPVLVHISRVAHEKNIDFLLHALVPIKNTLPDILLIIAGEGPALPHLKSLATALKLDKHILFVGYLSRDQALLDCYKAGDLFIFASRTETQGLVLLEAMACGTPVVSTAVMGTKDILLPEHGAFIAEENHTDFANKVIQLLQDKDLRWSLSLEARAYAKKWSAHEFALKMLEFYQSLQHQNTSNTSAFKNPVDVL